MRVLLDVCLPHRLRLAPTSHDVQTAHFAGFDGLTDNALLDAMEGVFDVLVTCDQSIQWQQNLRHRSISVLLLEAPSNRLHDLLPLVPDLLKALGHIKLGQVTKIAR